MKVTAGDGVTRLSDGLHLNKDNSGLPGNDVQGLEATPDGTIWILTNAGLAVLRGDEISALDPANPPTWG